LKFTKIGGVRFHSYEEFIVGITHAASWVGLIEGHERQLGAAVPSNYFPGERNVPRHPKDAVPPPSKIPVPVGKAKSVESDSSYYGLSLSGLTESVSSTVIRMQEQFEETCRSAFSTLGDLMKVPFNEMLARGAAIVAGKKLTGTELEGAIINAVNAHLLASAEDKWAFEDLHSKVEDLSKEVKSLKDRNAELYGVNHKLKMALKGAGNSPPSDGTVRCTCLWCVFTRFIGRVATFLKFW
jgi:hypothetical protein